MRSCLRPRQKQYAARYPGGSEPSAARAAPRADLRPLAGVRGHLGELAAPASLALLLVGVVYVAVALSRPADVFWSSDQGSKFLQVQALLEGRYDLSIAYPGRWLDPELTFRPYAHAYVANGSIQLPWPMVWALPSGLLYAVLGRPGLVVLPVVGGLLAAWGAGRLAERVAPGSGWLAVLLAGLATPLLVYSTLFWEHAAAAGVFTVGMLLLPIDGRPRSRGALLLAGCCFGLATVWRNEIGIYSAAALAAVSPTWVRQRNWRAMGWVVTGLSLLHILAASHKLLFPATVAVRTDLLDLLHLSAERLIQNVVLHAPGLPADFLVGHREFGMHIAEPLRWGPAVGLALLGVARLATGRWRRPLQLIGLFMVGTATALLMAPPAVEGSHGFLVAAPFLALLLLATDVLGERPTGRFLVVFAAIALPLYVLAATMLFAKGFTIGGLEWGPRYLLPIYAPLAALAAAVLHRLVERRRRWEQGAGTVLAALGVGFQLTGLGQIDVPLRENREFGELIASLPPGLVVIGPAHRASKAPGLTEGRPVFCAETPAALKRWAGLALAAGHEEFWYVDRRPIPGDWLLPGSAAPASLGSIRGGRRYLALRYETSTVHAALHDVGPERVKCGAYFV